MRERTAREEFLITVHYEAKRAGLDPQLVLGLIQVESNFRKYAVSSAGARGYMQVMPFWIKLIGNNEHNLFNLRTNLRYGCVILRHYLDIEKGDLYRALGRYNGSLGRPEYPFPGRARLAARLALRRRGEHGGAVEMPTWAEATCAASRACRPCRPSSLSCHPCRASSWPGRPCASASSSPASARTG